MQTLIDAASGGGVSIGCGPINFDFDYSVIDQLWLEFDDVIESFNVLMVPFLSLFKTVEGNGLSPLARECSLTMNLRDEIVTFLKLQNVIQEIKIQFLRHSGGSRPMVDAHLF